MIEVTFTPIKLIINIHKKQSHTKSAGFHLPGMKMYTILLNWFVSVLKSHLDQLSLFNQFKH